MIEQSKPKESKQPKTKSTNKDSFISIDDFAKVELKVGKVISAESIPEAKKLLKFDAQVI
jgi:methionyl-tRNA synthetase